MCVFSAPLRFSARLRLCGSHRLAAPAGATLSRWTQPLRCDWCCGKELASKGNLARNPAAQIVDEQRENFHGDTREFRGDHSAGDRVSGRRYSLFIEKKCRRLWWFQLKWLRCLCKHSRQHVLQPSGFHQRRSRFFHWGQTGQQVATLGS